MAMQSDLMMQAKRQDEAFLADATSNAPSEEVLKRAWNEQSDGRCWGVGEMLGGLEGFWGCWRGVGGVGGVLGVLEGCWGGWRDVGGVGKVLGGWRGFGGVGGVLGGLKDWRVVVGAERLRV